MRAALCQINQFVGDLEGNSRRIEAFLDRAKEGGAELVLFPELALTGYPPDDLLLLPSFMEAQEEALQRLVSRSKRLSMVVGVARRERDPRGGWLLYNSAAIAVDGELVGFQDKSLLPTYDLFDERRYFEPARTLCLWDLCGKRVAIAICEDLWQGHPRGFRPTYRIDPMERLLKLEPELLLSLSASPFSSGKSQWRAEVASRAARLLGVAHLACNQVGGNDNLIFDGQSALYSAEGRCLARARPFEEELLIFDLDSPPTPLKEEPENEWEELCGALILGTRDYCRKAGFETACLGLSGGIDSALVAYLAAEALGRERVTALAMPSRYSSEGSLRDAKELSNRLGIHYRELSIEPPLCAYLELLERENALQGCVEENLQARIRGALLMAFSNAFGSLLISTGNKSEMAVGYATLYGDMCGGLGVIADVTKRRVYGLARWINREREIIPQAILEKPPSAELRPGQLDSDSLPPYDFLDLVVEEYVERHRSAEEIAKLSLHPLEEVESLIQKIHQNEYKRRQAPPGLRVTERAFSIGRRFPIVQGWVRKEESDHEQKAACSP